jgi:hypothetical protein
MFRWYPALTRTYWDATFDPASKPAEPAAPNTPSAPTQISTVQAFNENRRSGVWIQWTGNDPGAELDFGSMLSDIRVTVARGARAANVSCRDCNRVLIEGPGKLCGFTLSGGDDVVVRGLVIDNDGGENCGIGFGYNNRFALVCNAILSDNLNNPAQSTGAYWENVNDGLVASNNIGVHKLVMGGVSTNNWGIRIDPTNDDALIASERVAFIDNWIMAGFQQGGEQGGQGPIRLVGHRFTLGHTPNREQRMYGVTGLYLGGPLPVRNEDVVDVGTIYHAQTPDESWHYGVTSGSGVDHFRARALVFYGPPTTTLRDRQNEAMSGDSTDLDYGIDSATYNPVMDPYGTWSTLVCPEIGELPVSDPYQIRSGG